VSRHQIKGKIIMQMRWPYVLNFLYVALTAAFLGFIAYIAIKGEMFVLWPNVTLFITLAIALDTLLAA